MRVLYVAHYFLPFSIGGTEEYTYLLAREMVRRGHAAHVFHGVIGRPELREYEVVEHEYEGLDCTCVSVDLKEIDDFSGTWRQTEVERLFRALLEQREFDVAHVQHLTRLSLGIIDVLHEHGIPVLFTLHDYWMQCARGQRVKPDGTVCHAIVEDECARCMAGDVDFLDRRKSRWEKLGLLGSRGTHARHLQLIRRRRREMLAALTSADLVVSASRFLRDAFVDYGVEREIRVEPYGVDLALARGYAASTSPRLRFGFVGRMEATKGPETLVDAFLRVEADAELHVHGFGPDDLEQRLRERAAGDPRVHFHGRFERADLPAIYAGFDVLVVPSTWLECSPLVCQTALLFRKPMIVSDIGGLAEIADATPGVLRFRAGEPRELAAHLAELAGRPDRVEELRRSLPAPRTFEAHADVIEGFYRELVPQK